jgi:hypothetical protein
MMKILVLLFLTLCTAAPAAANLQPSIIFSQEVIAVNEDGSLLPPVQIEPETMAGMQTHDFDLGHERQLRIHTNIGNAEERGLDEVAATIKHCYSYIETTTGRTLNGGVMLYLIELDEIPYAYNFQASYDDATQWAEVRLALIDRGTSLTNPRATNSLNDLLYDTLPHELGHDVLSSIPQLMHDIDGDASNHTRWFIEGICEVLAKSFSRREAPSLYKYFLQLRNVGDVLAETEMRTDLLSWEQNNDNGMVLESDLYGAAMLTMMVWTEAITMNELFTELASGNGQVCGTDLVDMMHKTTGLGPRQILARAHSHGQNLNEKIVLASLQLKDAVN